jgi:hypothetical protein
MVYLGILFFLIVIVCSNEDDKSKKNNRNLDSDAYSDIRIHIDANCYISNLDTSPTEMIKKRAIEKAKETLQELIKVERIKQPLNLYDYRDILREQFRTCATPFLTPTYVDADLVIFVRYSNVDVDGTVDFASSEIIKYIDNDNTKRPIAGAIAVNFDTSYLKDENSKLQALSTMFLHEFTHILGFNKTIFELKGLINTTQIKSRMNNRNLSKQFFIGPKAVKMAQNYFNCKNLPGNGIELDNINGQESKDGNSIHWSGRILMGDYMIAEIYYIEQAISEITLASLEDLGYYEVNYYTGGLMRFGKNKGCNFLTLDCIEYNKESPKGIKTTFPNEFCSRIYESIDQVFGTCSPGRQSMGFCFKS